MKIGDREYLMDERPTELMTLNGTRGWWVWVTNRDSGLEAHDYIEQERVKGEFRKFAIIDSKPTKTYQVWGLK